VRFVLKIEKQNPAFKKKSWLLLPNSTAFESDDLAAMFVPASCIHGAITDRVLRIDHTRLALVSMTKPYMIPDEGPTSNCASLMWVLAGGVEPPESLSQSKFGE
jgi:hypothetical protein